MKAAIFGSVLGLTTVLWGSVALAETLELGDPLVSQLTEETFEDRYTLAGEEGQTLNLLLTSADFDTFLAVLDPDGEELALNDDAAGFGLNSRIGPLVLPEDGEYTVVVTSFQHRFSEGEDGATGEYRLVASEVEVLPLEVGVPLTGSLTPESPIAFFSSELEEGARLIGSLSTEDFDGVLVLQTEDLETVADSLGFGLEGDSVQISSNRTLPSGTYLWMVSSSVDSVPEGDFELVVEAPTPEVISLGEQVQGSLVEGMGPFYSFEAEANTVISVRLEGDEDFEGYVTLADLDGLEAGYGDASGGNPGIIPSYIIPRSGTYTLSVQSFSGHSGEFELSLEMAELMALTADPLELAFGEGLTEQVLRFDAEADTAYVFAIDQVFEPGEVSNRGLNWSILRGTELISEVYESGSITGRTFTLEFPEDDTYFLRISDFSQYEDFERPWAATVTVSLTEE